MAALEGKLVKMERDYSDEVDKQLPRCKELAMVRTDENSSHSVFSISFANVCPGIISFFFFSDVSLCP